MSKKKGSRAGGKYTGSHTTVIPAAGEVADIADRCELVTKIALGFIKAGLPPAKGIRRLKLKQDGASLLLSVRDNTSHQELHVYATDLDKAKDTIAFGAAAIGLQVSVV